jgi:hypothetical protein
MTAQSSVPFGARSNICRRRHFRRRPLNKTLRAKIVPNPITRLRYDFCKTMFALAPPTIQLCQEWFFKLTFRPVPNRSFDICLSRSSTPWTWRLPSDRPRDKFRKWNDPVADLTRTRCSAAGDWSEVLAGLGFEAERLNQLCALETATNRRRPVNIEGPPLKDHGPSSHAPMSENELSRNASQT